MEWSGGPTLIRCYKYFITRTRYDWKCCMFCTGWRKQNFIGIFMDKESVDNPELTTRKGQHLYLGWVNYSIFFLGWSVLCDPRVLSLYHIIFTCNFATLAILDLYLCNMCATKANKQSSHLWNKSDLALYQPNSCKFTNTFHLILLNPRVWP